LASVLDPAHEIGLQVKGARVASWMMPSREDVKMGRSQAAAGVGGRENQSGQHPVVFPIWQVAAHPIPSRAIIEPVLPWVVSDPNEKQAVMAALCCQKKNISSRPWPRSWVWVTRNQRVHAFSSSWHLGRPLIADPATPTSMTPAA
jgi:hypothetical protein